MADALGKERINLPCSGLREKTERDIGISPHKSTTDYASEK